MGYIYEIVEADVDGCGTDASVYVASPDVLSPKEEDVLKKCLDGVKSNRSADDWDTDDMVDEALERFFSETGRKLGIADSPVCGTIVF